MFGKVKPDRLMSFVMMCLRIGACVPPPANAGLFAKIFYRGYWWFSFFVSMSFSLPVMYDTYLNRNNVNSIIANGAELCPMCTTSWKILLTKYYEKELQACILEMQNFLKTASIQKQELVQRYIDRCTGFYYFMLLCIVSTIFGFSSVPIFLPQPYPTHGTYPFAVNTETLLNSMRALQILGIVQTALFVTMDFGFSMLIWFAGARFELLSEDLKNVSDIDQLRLSIKKHQKVLRYSEDVILIVRYIAGGVGLSTAIGTVLGGLQLLQENATLMDRARYVSFSLVGALELYMYAWPAENLLETSQSIAYAAYSSKWVGELPEMSKLIYIIIQRARRPAIISIDGFIPELSLDFYKTFLSTSFSYFTTLRATTTAGNSD